MPKRAALKRAAACGSRHRTSERLTAAQKVASSSDRSGQSKSGSADSAPGLRSERGPRLRVLMVEDDRELAEAIATGGLTAAAADLPAARVTFPARLAHVRVAVDRGALDRPFPAAHPAAAYRRPDRRSTHRRGGSSTSAYADEVLHPRTPRLPGRDPIP